MLTSDFVPASRKRRCSHCNQFKLITDFRIEQAKAKSHSWCKDCERVYNIAYQKRRRAVRDRAYLRAAHSSAKAYRTNPQYALSRRIQVAMSNYLAGRNRSSWWQTDVGFTVADLRQRIESTFTSGMSWENYGEWHVDHIVPLCSFGKRLSDVTSQEFRAAWALNNLQALWAADHAAKARRVTVGVA